MSHKTPSELRKLSGSNLARLNKREARFTKLESATAKLPKWMDEIAREHFAEVSPELIANRLLDRGNFYLWCLGCGAYSRYVHAMEDVKERGHNIDEDVFNHRGDITGSKSRHNPNLAEASKALHDYLRVCVEFGLTPAASTKVNAEPGMGSDKGNSFADFVGGEEAEQEDASNVLAN